MNDLKVEIPASMTDIGGVTLMTSYDDINKKEFEILKSALDDYTVSERGHLYDVLANGENTAEELTVDLINELAGMVHYDLSSLNRANRMILKQVTADALFGRCYEAIFSNINTEYKLDYPKTLENEDEEMIIEIKDAIDRFNEDINIRELIRDAVSVTFLEGNCSLMLRLEDDGASVSRYPLQFAYPSEYICNGERVLEFSIKDLKSYLKKTYKKDKKNKALYMKDIDDEIKQSYPTEVYKSYKDGNNYCALDTDMTGCLQVGTMGQRFGVSPFFRCLKPLIVLNNIEAADVASSKARSKKIIFQKLRKETMGTSYEKKGLAEQKLAHKEAASAIQTNFGLYTAAPFVEDLKYVIDDSKLTDSDLISFYSSKLLTGLGIGFSDTNVANYSVANISVSQLMRSINSVSQQLERVLRKFYKRLLEYHGVDVKYAPRIRIIDSEMMDWSLRKEISSLLYGTFNGSRKTSMELIGVDVEDERMQREYENDGQWDEVFKPRLTAYTTSGDDMIDTDDGGTKPKTAEDKAKSDSDADRYKNQ